MLSPSRWMEPPHPSPPRPTTGPPGWEARCAGELPHHDVKKVRSPTIWIELMSPTDHTGPATISCAHKPSTHATPPQEWPQNPQLSGSAAREPASQTGRAGTVGGACASTSYQPASTASG